MWSASGKAYFQIPSGGWASSRPERAQNHRRVHSYIFSDTCKGRSRWRRNRRGEEGGTVRRGFSFSGFPTFPLRVSRNSKNSTSPHQQGREIGRRILRPDGPLLSRRSHPFPMTPHRYAGIPGNPQFILPGQIPLDLQPIWWYPIPTFPQTKSPPESNSTLRSGFFSGRSWFFLSNSFFLKLSNPEFLCGGKREKGRFPYQVGEAPQVLKFLGWQECPR